MAEPAQQFSLWVFGNFSKVYVEIGDLTVRRIYVRSTYSNILNIFFLPTVKRGSSNGGKSYEIYRNPALFDRKSGLMTGYPALRLDEVQTVNIKMQK